MFEKKIGLFYINLLKSFQTISIDINKYSYDKHIYIYYIQTFENFYYILFTLRLLEITFLICTKLFVKS